MSGSKRFFTVAALEPLFEALRRRGFQPVGPTVREGAIVYARLDSPAELPIGWGDEQDGGRYRLRRRDDEARFGYVVGPHSWKQFLFPPRLRLWSARGGDGGGLVEITAEPEPPERYAFIGVRACELHGIALQDRVFLEGPYVDETYRTLRERTLIVAVHCAEAGGTCFCVSMETGPECGAGFDLALTELLDGEEHGFLVEIGSDRGGELLDEVPQREPGAAEIGAADAAVRRAASQMGRQLDTSGIRELLYDNQEHARWSEVAERCLACGNCTLACPTCFCWSVEDVTDLTGSAAERLRDWASCFTTDYSYIHGGSVRRSTSARYRHWLTHKLAAWIDQFGTSGCVGCGRCITWCPVAIDITEEVAAIRESPRRSDGR